jgi:hypothetical protein
METQKIDLEPAAAGILYREYLAERHFSKPIDDEIRRVYREIAKGGVVIRALASIRDAGVNAQGLPKLAIVRAINDECFFYWRYDGSGRLAATEHYLHSSRPAADMAFDFAPGTFPQATAPWQNFRAIAPLIPIKLRPKKGLEKYHILWEAEWTPVAPADPVLLRRLGVGDMWLVVAAWDLTAVEQAALTARIHA